MERPRHAVRLAAQALGLETLLDDPLPYIIPSTVTFVDQVCPMTVLTVRLTRDPWHCAHRRLSFWGESLTGCLYRSWYGWTLEAC